MGRLRPFSPPDTDRVLTLLREPDVRRFLCDDRLLSRAEVGDMLDASRQLGGDGLGFWAIEDLHGAFAGIVGLTPVSPEASVSPVMTGGIEPTIAIHRDFTSSGLAFQALNAVVEHARSTLHLPRLVAAVDAPNVRSHRLMLRTGFRETDRAPGPAHTLILYERLLQSPG